MKAAKLDSSPRLQRVYRLLHKRGARGATTREIIESANVCAVNSIVSELRENGIDVDCVCEGFTSEGARIQRYTIPGLPMPGLFEAM